MQFSYDLPSITVDGLKATMGITNEDLGIIFSLCE